MEVAKAYPAFGAHGPVANEPNSQQRKQTGSVKPGNKIQEAVIVDFGDEKHGRKTGGDKKDLLKMVAGVLGVYGGRVDFEDRDRAEQENHAQQQPVEIAKAEKTAHQG